MKITNWPNHVTCHGFVLVFVLLGIVAAENGARGTEPHIGPGLVLWLDAQDIDGDGDTRDNPAQGQPVDRWTDKSGHGNHATQNLPDRQPYVAVDGMKPGLSSVHFNALQREYLSAGNQASLNLAQVTAFVVARAQPHNANMWLFGKNRFDSFWTGYGIAVEQGTSSPWPHLGLGRATAAENGYVRYDAGIRGGPAIVEIVLSASRLYGLLNGKIDKAQISAGNLQANELDLLIGASPQTSPACEFFQGDIAEILIYDRPLSSPARRQTRQYLAEKYGVPMAANDHPMVVLENGYLPVVVDNPSTPETRTASRPGGGRDSWNGIGDFRHWEPRCWIAASLRSSGREQLAARLANTGRPPDLNGELG